MTRTNKARLERLERAAQERDTAKPGIIYVIDWRDDEPLRDEDEGVTWVRDWRGRPKPKGIVIAEVGLDVDVDRI